MKNLFFGIMIFLGMFNIKTSHATAGYKVVFENTSKESADWTALLNNVENTMNALDKKVEIEIISHGPGLQFLMNYDQTLIKRMKELAGKKVHFMACENTLKKQKLKKEDLLSFSETVDSGVAELVRKQQEGWSYIKSGP